MTNTIQTIDWKDTSYLLVIPDPEQFRLDFLDWIDDNPDEKTQLLLDEIAERLVLAEIKFGDNDEIIMDLNQVRDTWNFQHYD